VVTDTLPISADKRFPTLTVLPIAGPLLALVLGIGPGELFGGSRLTQGCLVLGLCLAGIGRWWVRRMVRAVARGPMIA